MAEKTWPGDRDDVDGNDPQERGEGSGLWGEQDEVEIEFQSISDEEFMEETDRHEQAEDEDGR